MRTAILLTIPYVLLSSTGLVLIKGALNTWDPLHRDEFWRFALSPGFVGGSICYVGGYALYIAALRLADLTAIFPIATGMFFLTVGALGVVALGESLTWNRVTGMGLILAGIWVTSLR